MPNQDLLQRQKSNKMEESKEAQNVAGQVVDIMANAGIKHVYAITGDSLNALTDAISKDGRIKFIHMRHEESGAFAASAEAQLTGHPACCAGSSGPGHVHLINGLYDAQRSNAPVLAIASTCPSSLFGTGYFQETKPELLFSNCSVYNEMAANPSQVPHMLHGTLQHAVSEGGVGVVGLPADVITEPAVDDSASTMMFATTQKPEPTADEINACAKALNDAAKVAIFAGCGAAGATNELKELAEKLNAPVVTTFKSQMELTRDCPNYVGHLGYMGMWSAVDAIAQADVVLMIGSNFPFPGFFPDGHRTIQVDIRAERLGKVADLHTGIRADAGLFINALLPNINPKTDRTFLDSALKAYADVRKLMLKPVDNPGTDGAIRPEYVFHTLDRLADDNCIFTVDTGMNCVWSSHYLTPSKGRNMIGSFTHGSMANALPQAIGASVCSPDRQVIALSGDGGLTMLMGDLLTIIQYKLPVKILVADNRSLAYVKWEMELAGYKPSEVSLTNPDFGEMAKTMGFTAETVTEPQKLEDAMARWLKTPGPALLSVVTDPDAASLTFSKELVDKASPTNVVENFMPLGN